MNDVSDLIPIAQMLLAAAVFVWLLNKLASFLTQCSDARTGRSRRRIAREPEGLAPDEIVRATSLVRESRIERGKIADEELA